MVSWLFAPEEDNVRLHLGCGRTILPGFVNVDRVAAPGVDVVADLDDCARTRLPFEDDTVDEVYMSHVLEHVRDTLSLMAELHRVAKRGAVITARVPHGASDDAWEDPTHVRAYFPGSFGYFSQPYYWRADYGYRGDWQPERLTLYVPLSTDPLADTVASRVKYERNLVIEMEVTLRAVKPIRPCRRDLIVPPDVRIVPV